MGTDFDREKMEALEAGQRALASLNLALKDLNSAKTWGVVDMFSGGGFLTHVVKQSKMDKANAHMKQAEMDLRVLSQELQDINIAYELDLNISDFLSMADFFFDNFFVDWEVQARINSAAGQVESAIEMVKRVMSQIEMY